ncbi:DUF2840 domain-containing protein [Paracoccus methylovorus]|uniref:DUF2840 domain-containing protein n=2 Tax=Paracoccus TaxID=265 RepID=A0A7H9BYI7_PARPN|nr:MULTISPECIES: DUF2840 domain-containing protein [Paracoccus]QFQ88815.1 DUF2840 domain-containing protein [Paracoccus kondratievae]QLH16119.1 DUF2840 domain-containing protein [Paracoccus pantotrophus]QRZ15635.1 DUF2840 domain-containing protein [Paracoccus methylovorus]
MSTAHHDTTGAEPPALTLVELIWQQKKNERWLRFGRFCHDARIDRSRRIVGFAPGSIFALVRWAGNDYGTVASNLDILRAVTRAEPFQTLPFIRPGAEILLSAVGWPKVERVLQAIDAIEALKIDPCTVSPEHWRHIHNRLAADQPFCSYTKAQHAAWLKRRDILP